MTKIALSLFLGLVCVFAFQPSVNAQKSFEGKLTYTIEYVKIPEEMKGMESMLPQGMLTYIKGNKSRTEQDAGMGGKTIIIHDNDKMETMVMMDMFGQKMAIVPTAAEQKESQAEMDKMQVEFSSETKEIAGYKCKKAMVTAPDMDFPFTVFYTDEIPNGNAQYTKLPGMPLEYTMEQQGMKMKISVTTIDKEKVDASVFEIPKDYEKLTGEELQKKFGALGQ